MSKYFNFKSIALFLSVIFCMSSCGSNNKTEDGTTDSVASTDTAPSSNLAVRKEAKAAALAGGTLYNLFADAKKFTDLEKKRKVVFSFTFSDPAVLTLLGWQCKNERCTDDFLKVPDIEMDKAKGNGVPYGANVILGNVVILKDDIELLQKAISGYKYVVFVPEMAGSFVKYNIHVTNEDIKATFTAASLHDTDIDTNPSPPKNNSN